MSATATTPQHQRPSLLGTDAGRFWSLTWTLAVTDFKLRFYGSVLGYVWTLARPFLFFGVIYFVFTEIVGLDKNVPNYGVYILFALVLFQFFTEATGNCVAALVARESMLRKMRFPRLVIPASVVLTASFNLLLNLIVVFVFAIAAGVRPHWGWLLLPVIVIAIWALCFGLAMLLSALFVRFRDIAPIWEVVLQALFYATPILYPIETVQAHSPELATAMMANPLATIMEQARVWIIDPSAPTAADVIGSVARLLIPIGLIFATVLIGFWYYNREAPRIAERL